MAAMGCRRDGSRMKAMVTSFRIVCSASTQAMCQAPKRLQSHRSQEVLVLSAGQRHRRPSQNRRDRQSFVCSFVRPFIAPV